MTTFLQSVTSAGAP